MKILFVCTHNACRSVLAEIVARKLGAGRLQSASAGSAPAGRIHPLTLDYLTTKGIATDGLSSQGMDEFESFAPDLVITVCDRAAGESCPLWMGDTAKAHWGLPDPSHTDGGPAAVTAAFDNVYQLITRRIERMLDEPLESMSAAELQALATRVAEQVPA
ncbi:arsenate reductase ArsC [Gilvimarinus polysaccharolyticus]|uniref:arsenate reductase ArsC n=1 Tax=Gilvimarinus polysaccharolyticus TaxID=863921 RepID=UPI00067319A8|nr:arsenate reductase ArsC [Gilvimarinus polysaccharolyticus]